MALHAHAYIMVHLVTKSLDWMPHDVARVIKSCSYSMTVYRIDNCLIKNQQIYIYIDIVHQSLS